MAQTRTIFKSTWRQLSGKGVFSIFGNDNLNSPLNLEHLPIIHQYTPMIWRQRRSSNVNTCKASISINSQGRAKLLENGNIFIDDGTRAFILDAGGNIKLSYSHPVTNTSVGAMHWTRYYSSIDEVEWWTMAL